MSVTARPREPKSDEEVLKGVLRQVAAVGRRAGTADPDSARLLRLLEEEVEQAWAAAVAGWRETGFSDTEIGRELGVSKQAVQQRWPRG